MASNAEDFVISISTTGGAEAQAATSAVAQLEAQLREADAAAAAIASRLDEPLKSSTYRDAADGAAALRDQLAALDPANAAVAESAAAAAAAEAEVGDAAGEAGDAAGGASINLGAMAKASKMLGGDLGGTASKALRLGKAFMQMGPEVAAAVVAFAVMAAAIGAVIAVIAKGISAAGALRDELLKFQGAAHGSASAAAALESAVNAVNGSTGLGRDKLVDYATQLSKAGIQGAELQRALQAMAVAGSAGGEDMAAAFLKSAAAAHATGGSVDALSAKMVKELGGVASEQALSLSAQFAKLSNDISALFSGADLEPLLKGIHSLLSLFDQSNAGAQTLKASITAFVNEAIGAFLHAATAAVKLYIAIKSSTTAMFVIKAIAITVAVAFGLITAAILAVVAVAALFGAALAAPFVVVIAAVMGIVNVFRSGARAILDINWGSIGDAILAPFNVAWAAIVGVWNRITGAISGAYNTIHSMSWSEIGASIISGIVSGIMSAPGAILSALTGIISGAIDGAKALLHINSPSKVFHAIGASTGEGMSDGIEASGAEVAASAGGLARGAVAAASGPKAGAGKSGGPSFSFTNCVFGGDTTKEKIEEWIRPLLAGEALDAGAMA